MEKKEFLLQETRITLAPGNFLEGQNQTAKESVVSLTVLVNFKERYIFCRLKQTIKEYRCFLGSFQSPPRKSHIVLSATINSQGVTILLSFVLNRQEKYVFPWMLF